MPLPTQTPESERPFLEDERPFLEHERQPPPSERRRRVNLVAAVWFSIFILAFVPFMSLVVSLSSFDLKDTFGRMTDGVDILKDELKSLKSEMEKDKAMHTGNAALDTPTQAAPAAATATLEEIHSSDVVPNRKNPLAKYENEYIVFGNGTQLTSDAFPVPLEDGTKATVESLYRYQDPHRGEMPPGVLELLHNPPRLTPPPKPKTAPQIPPANSTVRSWSAALNGSRPTAADAERPETQETAHEWRPAPFAGWKPPIANLTQKPRPLPRVQYAFQNGSRFSGRNDDWQREALIRERRSMVKSAFVRAWQGYKTHAWGADELRPVSCTRSNPFNGWGATIVDSLDTLLVMGLHNEYDIARNHVHDIDFHYVGGSRSAYGQADGRVPVFETAIRYLGGLLSAYDLSGDVLMKERAEELAQLIMPSFETLSGLPIGRMRIDDQTNYTIEEPRGRYEKIVLAEATSMLLEFTRLWQVTGNRTYFDKVQRVTDFMDRNVTKLSKFGSLVTIGIYPRPLQLAGKYTLGGMADSYYEYLIKEYQLLGGRLEQYARMYGEAMDSAIKYLLRRIRVIAKAPSLIVAAEAHATPKRFGLKLEHLSCFTGAMFALSSKLVPTRTHDLEIARRYTETCWWMYNSTLTGLGPEDMLFYRPEDQDLYNIVEGAEGKLFRGSMNGDPIKGVRSMNGIHQNRPEAIESVLYMWRVTGDEVWQERGWQMFASWMTHALTSVGVSSIRDVMSVPAYKTDGQESFALAETFKYYYLLFSPPDLISLDDFVFTTEAHPLLVPKDGKWRAAGSRVPLLAEWKEPRPSASYMGGENGPRGGMTNAQKHEFAQALYRESSASTRADMAVESLRKQIDKMLATIKT